MAECKYLIQSGVRIYLRGKTYIALHPDWRSVKSAYGNLHVWVEYEPGIYPSSDEFAEWTPVTVHDAIAALGAPPSAWFVPRCKPYV